MSAMSESGAPQPPPHQQQQQAVAAAPPPNGRLSLEDISKYFNLPIADAASILGVCTSVLKRICRANGIIRWPYRKFLAGKTVDDIRKEAAREKNKELAGFKISQQSFDVSKMMLPTSVGLSSTFGNQVQNPAPGLLQEASKMQQGVSVPGNALHIPGNKNFQHGWSGAVQSNQTRHIPTYLDDFKYGFPANGLASASIKWWGSSNTESAERVVRGKPTSKDEGKQDSCELTNESSCMMIDDQADSNIKDCAITMEPSASLVSQRKRAVECGRESLPVGIANLESYKLGTRKKLVLVQVFTSSLPDQWKDG